MKEIIKNKIEEQINLMLSKEVLTIDEINFLTNEVSRIEIEENKEEDEKKHREMMEQLVKITTTL